jgi:hypothetical protein
MRPLAAPADVEDKVGRCVPIQNAHNLHCVPARLHAHSPTRQSSLHISTDTAHCTQYTRGHANSSQPTSQHPSSVLISSAQLPLVASSFDSPLTAWTRLPRSPPRAPPRSHALRQGGDQSSTISKGSKASTQLASIVLEHHFLSIAHSSKASKRRLGELTRSINIPPPPFFPRARSRVTLKPKAPLPPPHPPPIHLIPWRS